MKLNIPSSHFKTKAMQLKQRADHIAFMELPLDFATAIDLESRALSGLHWFIPNNRNAIVPGSTCHDNNKYLSEELHGAALKIKKSLSTHVY